MSSLFARVLKVAVPYTVFSVVAVSALPGDAKAQIAPECREMDFSAIFDNTASKRVKPANAYHNCEGECQFYSTSGKEVNLSYEVYDKAAKVLPVNAEFVHHTGLKKGEEVKFAKGKYDYYHSHVGSNIGSGTVKSCKVTNDPKTGFLKSVTMTYASASSPEAGSESGSFTLNLRTPTVNDQGMVDYEVGSVAYSVTTKGGKEKTLYPASSASGTVSFAVGSSKDGSINRGTLVASLNYEALFESLMNEWKRITGIRELTYDRSAWKVEAGQRDYFMNITNKLGTVFDAYRKTAAGRTLIQRINAVGAEVKLYGAASGEAGRYREAIGGGWITLNTRQMELSGPSHIAFVFAEEVSHTAIKGGNINLEEIIAKVNASHAAGKIIPGGEYPKTVGDHIREVHQDYTEMKPIGGVTKAQIDIMLKQLRDNKVFFIPPTEVQALYNLALTM